MTWLFSRALLRECAKSPSLPEPVADWLDGHCPRVTDISKHRADRVKAIGNGQVPRVAAAAFAILAARFGYGVLT